MVLCWYPFLLSKGDIKILFLIQWIQFLVYWIQFDKRLIQFWEFCFRSIVLAGCLTGSDVDSCNPRLLEQSAEINSSLSEIKEKRILIEYDLWLVVERNSWFAARRFYWISLFGHLAQVFSWQSTCEHTETEGTVWLDLLRRMREQQVLQEVGTRNRIWKSLDLTLPPSPSL